jgi:hypothetical protein
VSSTSPTTGPHVERELALVKVAGTGENRASKALRIADIFRARVVDSTTEPSSSSSPARPKRSQAFIDLMRPLGLVEVVAYRRRGDQPRTARRSNCRFEKGLRICMRVYYDRDADVEPDQGQEGRHRRLWQPGPCPCAEPARFGRQADVAVALRAGSATHEEGEGEPASRCMNPAEAAKWADVIMVLTPDEHQADIYANDLAPT